MTRLPRRVVLLAALAPLAAHAAPPDAAAPIEALNAGLLAAMRAGRATPFTQRYDTLAPVVERAFDLPAILQASVGPRWTGLPPAQQEQLLDVFRRFTVSSYLSSFNAFNGERIETLPENRAIGADQVVATQIVPAGAAPTRIDYIMRQTPGGWRAVDVLLNGSISRVAVQRSDFRSLLDQGSASRLIANLQGKVAELSGGALSG